MRGFGFRGICLCGLLAAFAAAAAQPVTDTKPLQLDGVPNGYQVSDTLWRSAQPTAAGFRRLKAEGVKTVVNLRAFHSDLDELKGIDLRYLPIPVKTWHPEEEAAVRFLREVTNPGNAPLLVHCQHGADRTGVMVALYRVAVQGWSKEKALKEMTEGPFGYHKVWVNLPPWFMELDIEKLKKLAGLTP